MVFCQYSIGPEIIWRPIWTEIGSSSGWVILREIEYLPLWATYSPWAIYGATRAFDLASEELLFGGEKNTAHKFIICFHKYRVATD